MQPTNVIISRIQNVSQPCLNCWTLLNQIENKVAFYILCFINLWSEITSSQSFSFSGVRHKRTTSVVSERLSHTRVCVKSCMFHPNNSFSLWVFGVRVSVGTLWLVLRVKILMPMFGKLKLEGYVSVQNALCLFSTCLLFIVGAGFWLLHHNHLAVINSCVCSKLVTSLLYWLCRLMLVCVCLCVKRNYIEQ